ncbi:hypothetical protein SprV_0301065400 [Sparganum proliferum]
MCMNHTYLLMSLMRGSSRNPKRQANKTPVPAIVSPSSRLLPGTRLFAPFTPDVKSARPSEVTAGFPRVGLTVSSSLSDWTRWLTPFGPGASAVQSVTGASTATPLISGLGKTEDAHRCTSPCERKLHASIEETGLLHVFRLRTNNND